MLNHSFKVPKYYVPAYDIFNQVAFSGLAYLARIIFFLIIQYLRPGVGVGEMGKGDQNMYLSF